MKLFAIVVSIFLPGIGTMIVGKIGLGILQLLLSVAAGTLAIIPLVGWIGGGAIYLVVWLWAMISVLMADTGSATGRAE